MAGSEKGRLVGKVVIVTGASGGIGRATALRLAEEGASVGCVDLAAPTSVEKEIAAAGGAALAIAADVTKKATMDAMAEAVVRRFGRIDAVHANAGIPGAGSVITATEEHWSKVIAVNLTGIYLTMQAVAPIMVEQKSGSIIAMTSVAAFMAFEDAAPYAASKGGVMALARQAAADLGKHDIRVNAIAPGMVPTGFLDATIALRGGAAGVENATRDTVIARTAQAGLLGRVGTPDEIASVVVFLASDESRWITGQTFTIDGGLSAR
ncbi:MAG: SDR family oxidoreductase [Rhizobiaceae bacterium]